MTAAGIAQRNKQGAPGRAQDASELWLARSRELGMILEALPLHVSGCSEQMCWLICYLDLQQQKDCWHLFSPKQLSNRAGSVLERGGNPGSAPQVALGGGTGAAGHGGSCPRGVQHCQDILRPNL